MDHSTWYYNEIKEINHMVDTWRKLFRRQRGPDKI